jgi:hypothetical protein
VNSSRPTLGKVKGTEIRLRLSAHFSGDTDKTVKPRGFDGDVDVTPRDFTASRLVFVSNQGAVELLIAASGIESTPVT